jgi:hypothetical protein
MPQQGPTLREFFLVVWRHWGPLMSGAFSVPFAALAYSSVGKKGEYRYSVHVEGRDAIPGMARLAVEWRESGYPLVTLEPLGNERKVY